MNPKIRHALLVSTLSLGTIAALAMTGCSESDDPVSNQQEQEQELGQEQEVSQSITEIAAADGNFSTLVAALQAAGLDETLAGEGSFTVFAPVDDAFAALPEGTIEALLADPEGDLTNILTYHVIGSVVKADEVVGLTEATTLQGSKISIEVVDGDVILNGSIKVTSTDIIANNGVIHVIDGVLIPTAEDNSDDEEVKEDEESQMDLTITEIAAADEQFSTLVTALEAAELDEVLNGTDNYTVFAPTNDAFAALAEGTLETLLADPTGDLADILLYHVVAGKVDASAVVGLTEAVTANGAKVGIEVVDGKVILNGNAEVVVTDIMAKNGIIHVIDAVILPQNGPKNIVETALADDQFSTLVTALTEAKLVETLSDEEGEFTVFAPTNAAFEALPEGTLEALLADPEGDLKDILLYHVVGAEVDAAAVVGLNYANTVEGSRVTIEVVNGKVILNGNAEVTTTDIQTTNGIIHVIDAVILPSNAPKSIAEIAAGNADLETLTTAVDAAGLTETLTAAGEFTVFAPTDAAFDALEASSPGTLDALLADPEGDLKNILLYHVVGSEVNASEVVTLTSAPSLESTEISIEVVNGKVILDGKAEVVITDIVANNGIVHVIDAVITP